jgi:hypothetical protein
MQVADCYIHVPYRRLRPGEFDILSDELYQVATDLARTVKRAHDLDFTFEEGSLIQRILLVGTFLLTSLDTASHYHDLRESVIDAVHDEKALSHIAIEKFHQITHTRPGQEIYKRTTSRDINRLHRIVSGFDKVAAGGISHKELVHIRADVIHDLAGLARANQNDPEIDKIFHFLPQNRIPDLPKSPTAAIALDEFELEHRTKPHEDVEEPPRRLRHRQFHKHIVLPKR